MSEAKYYDPIERQREKQRARAQDERYLREGRISPEALNRRNGFFSSLDLSNAQVRHRRRNKPTLVVWLRSWSNNQLK